MDRPNYEVAAHQFVVDGEISRVQYFALNGAWTRIMELPPLLHIIWGWEGRFNGYYVYNCTFGQVDSDIYEADNSEEDGMSLPNGFHYNNYRYYAGMYPVIEK